jgi:hypothetical protein
MVRLGLTIDTKGIAELQQFLLATAGKANRPTAVAMTRVSRRVEQEVKEQAPRHINRPTPWTMRSTFVRPAKPNRLEAEVGFKDYAVKGTPAARYLQPIAAGGRREPKPFEQRLRDAGVLAPNRYAIPSGIHPRPNQYGNMPAAEVVRVLSRLKALRSIGSTQNASDSRRSKRKRAAIPYFVLNDARGMDDGIYTRLPGSRLPVPAFWFVNRAPSYGVSFPVQEIMQRAFSQHWPAMFEQAIEEEMRYHARKL